MSNTLEHLESRVRSRRRQLDAASGEARSVITRLQEIKTEVGETTELVTDYERVAMLLTSIGEERQLRAQDTIESLVTRGLQAIFDESLSFHIVQTVKNKSANVEFLIRSTINDTSIDTSVMDSRGGGIAATVGFLLRVVVMLLDKGTNRENILVLDETFAHVSDEYLEPLGAFLREIVDLTGIQIVMVTHQPEFVDVADRAFRFKSVAGNTVVEEVS